MLQIYIAAMFFVFLIGCSLNQAQTNLGAKITLKKGEKDEIKASLITINQLNNQAAHISVWNNDTFELFLKMGIRKEVSNESYPIYTSASKYHLRSLNKKKVLSFRSFITQEKDNSLRAYPCVEIYHDENKFYIRELRDWSNDKLIVVNIEGSDNDVFYVEMPSLNRAGSEGFSKILGFKNNHLFLEDEKKNIYMISVYQMKKIKDFNFTIG